MAAPSTSRGRARRDAIVAAAATLVLTEGPAAITHRAVAALAEVPLGSTSYYFDDRTDLLAAAVDQASHDEAERAKAAASAPPRPGGLAHQLIDVVVDIDRARDPELAAAHYQRFIEATLADPVRMGVRLWNDAIRAGVGDVLDRHGVVHLSPEVVLALVDGCVLAWLVDDTGGAVDAGAGALDAGTGGDAAAEQPADPSEALVHRLTRVLASLTPPVGR